MASPGKTYCLVITNGGLLCGFLDYSSQTQVGLLASISMDTLAYWIHLSLETSATKSEELGASAM